jgi:hypothetical protein
MLSIQYILQLRFSPACCFWQTSQHLPPFVHCKWDIQHSSFYLHYCSYVSSCERSFMAVRHLYCDSLTWFGGRRGCGWKQQSWLRKSVKLCNKERFRITWQQTFFMHEIQVQDYSHRTSSSFLPTILEQMIGSKWKLLQKRCLFMPVLCTSNVPQPPEMVPSGTHFNHTYQCYTAL